MSAWYRVDIPPSECCRNGKADQLQKAFEATFIARRNPREAALFEWHDETLQTNVFFFSPEGAAMVQILVERFGGIECRPPLLSDRLVLLAGDGKVREKLEPSEGPIRAFLDKCCRGTRQP